MDSSEEREVLKQRINDQKAANPTQAISEEASDSESDDYDQNKAYMDQLASKFESKQNRLRDEDTEQIDQDLLNRFNRKQFKQKVAYFS